MGGLSWGIVAQHRFNTADVSRLRCILVVLSVGLPPLGAPLCDDIPGASVGAFLPEPVQRELSLVIPYEQFTIGNSSVVRVTS